MIWQISQDKTWDALSQRFKWVKVMDAVPQDPYHHAEAMWLSIPEWYSAHLSRRMYGNH